MANYKKKGAAGFFKRNAAYLIMIGCVILTALIIILASTPGKTGEVNAPPVPDLRGPAIPDTPVIVEPDSFVLPVSGASIGYTYNLEMPVKLSVPDRNNTYTWVLFREMEFIAAEGTPVVAVYDGRVTSVTYDVINGTIIKIEHEGGLVSVYKYLQKNAAVTVGTNIKKGDLIGHIGVSFNMQYNIGAHLCFGLIKDGVYINPTEYLPV